MADKFDILDYLSGLTAYVFDKSVLKRVAMERDVMSVTGIDELDTKTRDLLRADLLYAAYLSPNVWASYTNQHGSYSKTVGSQTIYVAEKERLYSTFMAIYKRYDDDKCQEIEGSQGNLQWLL
jgi:putative lipase involved disintegration of autophagic bodies